MTKPGVDPVPSPGSDAPARPHDGSWKVSGHLPALDGVRGLAVLMVLLLHFVANTTPTNLFERGLGWVLGYGSLGVDLFFVLSGFLITGILYDSRLAPNYFKNFYMRRVLRIFPLYYAVLIAVLAAGVLVPALRDSEQLAELRANQGWIWAYGVNVFLFLRGDWGGVGYLEHFWSLSVEEHFYFVWPLVVFLLAARPRALLKICLGVSVVALAARTAASLSGVPPVSIYVFTPFRLDALCLGAFLAVYARQPGGAERLRSGYGPVAAVAGALLVASFTFNRFSTAGYAFMRPVRSSLFLVLAGCLLLWALSGPRGGAVSKFFGSRPLRFLGKYSYGLYVYHHLLSYYLMTHGTEFALTARLGSHTLAVLIQCCAGIAASLLVAYASYELFEQRFLSLKRFFEASGEPKRAVGPVPGEQTQVG